MKKLYISDLDGTLLLPDTTISDFTRETLNMLIEKYALDFSFATAREPASALKITASLKLKAPVVMLNGALIYEPLSKIYLNIEYIEPRALMFVNKAMKKFDINGFIYCFEENDITAYYENLETPALAKVFNDRRVKYEQRFFNVASFSEMYEKPAVYFSITDIKEKLDKLYEVLSENQSLSLAYYADVYNAGHWFLEVFSSKASKYYAAKYIKSYMSAPYLVGFGDNFNDLPLKNAADFFCAVENGQPEIKNIADTVIKSNTQNGVAEYLLNEYIS